MTPVDVRLGTLGDVDDAALVYECSNLARRQGRWRSRAARVAQVTAGLHDAADHDPAAWFLVGRDGTEAVAMALVHPFRADGGSGDVVAGTWFLSLIYVLPERWGTSTRTSVPIDCTTAAALLPSGRRCRMVKAT
jgi:hypothetical protein